MSETTTIKEFLVAIGWQSNEAQHKKFVDALEIATVKAKLVGDAIEEVAVRVAHSLGDMIDSFDRLFFMTQRTGASIEAIRGLAYAASQMGSSIQDANSAVESMGRLLRENNNNPFIPNKLGFDEHLNYVKELGEQFAALPKWQQEQYGHMAGVSESFIEMLRHPDTVQKFLAESAKSMNSAGLSFKTLEDANKFATEFRSTWTELGNMAEGGLTRLLKGLTPILHEFETFLKANEEPINNALKAVAEGLVKVADGFERLLEKIDWKRVEENIKSFTGVANGLANSMGGLTIAFETFFAIWAGSKFISAIAAMGRFAGFLGLIYGSAKLIEFGATGPEGLPDVGGGTAGATINPGVNAGTDGDFKGRGIDPAGNGDGLGIVDSIKKWWGQTAPTWLGGNSEDNKASSADPITPGSATASSMIDRMMADYGLTREQAAGAVGWMGYESGDFKVMQERGQPYGSGGWGYAQWTGPRRRAFMNFANQNNLDPSSDAANYGFLQHELATNYAGVIPALKQARTVDEASSIWGHRFEGMTEGGPGVPAFAEHAARAWQYYRQPEVPDAVTTPREDPAAWWRTMPGWGAKPSTGSPAAAGEGMPSWAPTWGGLPALMNHFDSPPLGVTYEGDSATHISAPQNVTINIEGSEDPHVVAHMVASGMKRTNMDMVRNLTGAAG